MLLQRLVSALLSFGRFLDVRSRSVFNIHWGQGVVYQAGTLQIHCRNMDKVPTIY